MRTYPHFRSIFLYLPLLFIGSWSLVSCGSDRQVDSKEIASDLNKPKNDLAKESDERFMVRAVELHFEQILLGKLAFQRASSSEVRDFAKMLEEEHRNAKSAFGSLGIIKSIAVPATPTQSAHDSYDKLNEKKVEDFDRAYLADVIKGHNEIINIYEKCTNNDHDPDVRALAVKGLPDMRIHLAKAIELDTSLGPISEAIQ
jgi:putative membrane protein